MLGNIYLFRLSSLQENLEVDLRRIKTQMAEKEETIRNYERLLHEVAQPYSTVTNEFFNEYNFQSESEVTKQSEDKRLDWDREERNTLV